MPKIARLYLHPSRFCKTRRNPFVSRGRLDVLRRKAPAVLGGGGVTVTSSNTHLDNLLIHAGPPSLPGFSSFYIRGRILMDIGILPVYALVGCREEALRKQPEPTTTLRLPL